MSDIDIEQLNGCVEEMKSLLKDGLLATDIWTIDGLSLASHNHQPAATALFGQITAEIRDTLANSGLPELGHFHLEDLDGDHTSVIIIHGEDLQQGMLLDNTKVNMGVLLAVAVPRAQELVANARR